MTETRPSTGKSQLGGMTHVTAGSTANSSGLLVCAILRLFSPLCTPDKPPRADPMLVNAFMSISRSFEHLSISFMIDSRQFFGVCKLSYTWYRLRSLKLTSSILTQTAPEGSISTLLYNAGLAALSMPQLESLVLWNSKGREAYAFVYHKEKATTRLATLTWRGAWDLKLSHDVVESWQKVASDSYYFWILNERVQDVINSMAMPFAVCACQLGPLIRCR